MKNTCFLDGFIDALHQKINKKSDLVSFISGALHIERDSALRRLNKKVYFTAEEIGILSLKLGISLDSLLFKSGSLYSPSLVMHTPMGSPSIQELAGQMELILQLLQEVCLEPAEYGIIFTYPPIELLIPHKHLLKFAYFKWGYYYVGEHGFCNYSAWEVPKGMQALSGKAMDICGRWEKILYIWDISAVWSFTRDVAYFASIGIISGNDLAAIQSELHDMLYRMEDTISCTKPYTAQGQTLEVYVPSVHIGANVSYFISGKRWYNSYHTFFSTANYNGDYQACMQIREWVHAMKRVCTLISGSGARERKLFFEEQHKTVDSINP